MMQPICTCSVFIEDGKEAGIAINPNCPVHIRQLFPVIEQVSVASRVYRQIGGSKHTSHSPSREA